MTVMRGVLLVGAGWLFLVLAVLTTLLLGSVPLLAGLGLLGAAGVVVGCHLLARGKANWVYPAGVFGCVAIVAGFGIGGQQLVLELGGETAGCEVTKVERGLGVTGAGSRIRYVHTVACPGETYTMSARPPYATGDKVDVTYDPRGTVDPRFTETMPGTARLVLLLGVASAGGLTVLVLPFTAWRRGRRWAAAAQFPPQPMPAAGEWKAG